MGQIKVEPKYISDVVHWEEESSRFSREETIVPLGTAVEKGNILGQVTATKKWVPLNPAASDGSQIAKRVAITDIPNTTTADVNTVAMARHCVVKASGLVWPGGITAPQKATALDQLAALNILVR